MTGENSYFLNKFLCVCGSTFLTTRKIVRNGPSCCGFFRNGFQEGPSSIGDGAGTTY